MRDILRRETAWKWRKMFHVKHWEEKRVPCPPISNHRAFEENKPPLKGEGDRRQAVERSSSVIFYVMYVYSIFVETPQSVLRTASSY